MKRAPQLWEVTLDVDGRQVVREERVDAGGITCADAEVQAIRAEESAGGTRVRCLRSRFVREVRS